MKKFARFLIFFLLCSNCYAQIFLKNKPQSFHLSLEPFFSYTNGTLNEVIYRSSDNDSKISLLEWNRKIFTYGANVKSQFYNFYFDLGFRTSFQNQKSGEMEDSDWLNPNDYSMKTTYSVGTNYAEKNYEANVSVSYKFESLKCFFIEPKIQFQYMYDSFYRKKGAKGWYGQVEDDYGSTDGNYHWWYEEEAREYPYYNPLTGKTRKLAGIDYERHNFYVWMGGNIGIKIERFCIDLGFMISPFTYFSAEDRHHTSGEDTVYHEIQQDYFTSFKFSFNFIYSISKYFDVVLKIENLIAKNIKGDFYEDWSKITTQPSGASAALTTAEIGLVVKLF